MEQTVASESLDIEKSVSFKNLSSDILNSEKNKTGFSIKNFFNCSADWEFIVKLIHSESQIPNDGLKEAVAASVLKSGIDEKVHGSVLVVEGLYYSIGFTGQDKPIESLQEVDNIISGLSETMLIGIGGKALKVSIGPKMVEFHEDQWGALVCQITGKSTWGLKYPSTSYEEYFDLEPGDLLYFPKGMLHSVKSHSPRSSVIIPVEMLQDAK
jgi:hypothetical protein